MPNLADIKNCTGCTACESTCPFGAIIMEPDCLGFLYPKVDMSKCCGCGKCEKACVICKGYDTSRNFDTPICYGARHKSLREVMNSRSGAVFVAISDYVLDEGGVVYGAGYSDHFRVVHKRAETKNKRDEFRGSKYVQSDMRGVFKSVKQDVMDGRMVLFSGTPCQTAALNALIDVRDRSKLVLVDIVCHGVPAPNIWRDYLSYIEAKKREEIEAVSFRDKILFGWSDHKETFVFKDGKIGVGSGNGEQWFTYNFYKHILFRHSCGRCQFANTHRPSDITLADFWGWNKVLPELNSDNMGASLVLVNTSLGKEVFAVARKDLHYFKVRLEDVMQPNLSRPSEVSSLRDAFEQDYADYGFEYVFEKYSPPVTPLLKRVKQNLKTYLKVALRRHKLGRKR